MACAKECATPMSSTSILQFNDGSPSTNAITFLQVVGALQYLSLTWPDVSYVVNHLAKFLHCPSKLHWLATKRVLRYLKSATHHGFFLKRHQSLTLTFFTDTDWVVIMIIASSLPLIFFTLVGILFLGAQRNKNQWPVLQLKQNIEP